MPTDLRKLCALLYGVFALAALMQFSFFTMFIGMIVMLVAVGIAYAKRKEAAGTAYESHLRWLIRTFWIGGGVYLPVATVVESIFLFFMFMRSDTDALMQKINSGQLNDPRDMEAFLISQYGHTLLWMTLVFTLPFLAWWLWRCWSGYRLLKEGKSIPDPESWL
jgi:uncharacterized membrane protein